MNNNPEVIEIFKELYKKKNDLSCVEDTLKNSKFWDVDLTEVEGLRENVEELYNSFLQNGINNATEELMSIKATIINKNKYFNKWG